MRRRILRTTVVAFAALWALGLDCQGKEAGLFDPIDDDLIPGLGDIFGTVTVDGEGRSGVTVTVRQGTEVAATATTDGNGDYEVINLDPGTYTVSIGSIGGASCPGDQTATVVADDDTPVDFACTSQATTGTVTGTVTANGSPVQAATVALDGRTTTTDANGSFAFTDVDPDTYTVTATADGFTCDPQTTTVTAGETSTVNVSCTSSAPSGTEIAGLSYGLMGSIVGTDGCGTGNTISNPGPITVRFDPATNTLTIESDADVAGTYVPGQPWTGTGESTLSSGGMTFILRETATGTWQRSSGTIVLPGTLTFEVFQGSTKQCESGYNGTYEALAPSSIRFKRDVKYLLPDGIAILGLRPVSYRYLAPYGDSASPRLGLIAEDVASVYADAVGFDADGRPAGIYYGALRSLVIEKLASRSRMAAESWIARLAESM